MDLGAMSLDVNGVILSEVFLEVIMNCRRCFRVCRVDINDIELVLLGFQTSPLALVSFKPRVPIGGYSRKSAPGKKSLQGHWETPSVPSDTASTGDSVLGMLRWLSDQFQMLPDSLNPITDFPDVKKPSLRRRPSHGPRDTN